MIAFIWKLITAGLWKPLLAVLGALGLYVKARFDQKKSEQLKDAKANVKTIEDVLREGASDDPADVIRERMRQRARKP